MTPWGEVGEGGCEYAIEGRFCGGVEMGMGMGAEGEGEGEWGGAEEAEEGEGEHCWLNGKGDVEGVIDLKGLRLKWGQNQGSGCIIPL